MTRGGVLRLDTLFKTLQQDSGIAIDSPQTLHCGRDPIDLAHWRILTEGCAGYVEAPVVGADLLEDGQSNGWAAHLFQELDSAHSRGKP